MILAASKNVEASKTKQLFGHFLTFLYFKERRAKTMFSRFLQVLQRKTFTEFSDFMGNVLTLAIRVFGAKLAMLETE